MTDSAQNNESNITENSVTIEGGSAKSAKVIDDVCDIATAEGIQGVVAPVVVDRPEAGDSYSLTIQPGKEYFLDFEQTEVKHMVNQDGNLTITLNDGGSIELVDFIPATNDENLPAKAAFRDPFALSEFSEMIEVVETTQPSEEQLQEPQSEVRHESQEQAAVQETQEHTNEQVSVAKIEPAAGDDAAQRVAQIEPAAGDDAGGAADNSGYGFNSSFDPQGIVGLKDVGPLGPTALRYGVQFNNDIMFLEDKPEETPDDNPIVVDPQELVIDETALNGASQSVSGHVDADFGKDGPGTISPNGGFSADGSLLGGDLSSNGVDITVTETADGYEGYAGGVLVFDIAIDPDTGDYTFNQFEQIDHADGSNPDDVISLHFGVTAEDVDGDTANTEITISILDDAPILHDDNAGTIDEAGLGPVTVYGDLIEDSGEDTPAEITTTNTFNADGDVLNGALTSDGHAITVTATSTGYVGTANGVTVFELTITDQTTGEYEFTLYKGLDHANTGDIIDLHFGVEITDYDGDSDPAMITVSVEDDQPYIPENETPIIGQGYEVVDETNLGPVVVSGHVPHDIGGDTPGTFGATGGYDTNNLTSQGEQIVVSYDSNTGTYTGTAHGDTIFTLVVESNGNYTYTLLDQVDHPVAGSTAAAHNDSVQMSFDVQVEDADGDIDNGQIIIDVLDDGPDAVNDTVVFDQKVGFATGDVTINDHFSQDEFATGPENQVSQVSYGSTTVDVPADGTPATIDGHFGTLEIAVDGTYTYTLHPGAFADTPKHFTGTPGVEFPDMNESEALDASEQQTLGVASSDLDVSAGDHVTVAYVSEGAGYDNTLGGFTVAADGTLQAGYVMIANGNDVVGNENASFNVGAGGEQVGFFLIADGYAVNNGYAGLDFSNGDLNFVYDYGLATERAATVDDDGSHVSLVYSEGGVDTVLSGDVYYTTERGSADNLNADSSVRIVSDVAPGGDDTVLRIGFEDLPNLGDYDYNDIVFDVTISSPGCQCGDDEFTYTLLDSDGDTDTAILSFDCEQNDVPQVSVKPLEVDDTYITDTDSNVITADFGNDGEGAYYGSGDYDLNGLTSNGEAISVVYDSNTQTYTGSTSAGTVFTFVVESDGDYNFNLFRAVDHSDTNSDNESLQISFGVTAEDADGDATSANVDVTIYDDGLQAYSDTNAFDYLDGSTGGNVVTGENGGVNAADDLSNDVVNNVTQVSFGNVTVDVPETGTVDIDGDYGTLTIQANGTYTYTLDPDALDTTQTSGYTTKFYAQDRSSEAVNYQQTSITHNGITVSVDQGYDISWMSTSDGSGFGIDNLSTNDSLKAWPKGEDFDITFDKNPDEVLIRIAELGDNNDDGHHGADLDITLADGSVVHQEIQFDSGHINNGMFIFVLKDFGQAIESINLSSVDDGQYDGASFLLNKVFATYYPDCDPKDAQDVFEYTVTDADGDHSSASLTIDIDTPDEVHGTNGDDVITSEGPSADDLYGYDGDDVFLFTSIEDGVDTIHDFDNGHDVIDLSQVLEGYDPVQDSINDFVSASEVNGDTIISVDVDGAAGPAGFVELVHLNGVTGLDVQDITNNGEAVV